jgi:pimeloyl-ACP methyl ester carboxylesterase
MRVVYLHGFASGPLSTKARKLREDLARVGLTVHVPDLNLPDFEHLRISRMVEHVAGLARGEAPAVLVGSSLGALVALHASAVAPEVAALVLLAPALVPDERWRAWIGPEGIEAWRRDGTRPFYNYVTESERPIDFGFYEDLVRHARPPAPRVPVRLIHGQHDLAVPVEASEEFARAHPDKVWLTVVDDDHGLLQHVDLIREAILDAVAGAGRADR